MEDKLKIHEYNLLGPDEKYFIDTIVGCLQKIFMYVLGTKLKNGV